MAIKFYICDIETNGLSLQYHVPFQISFIRVDDRVQFTKQIKVLNPQLSSLDALAITGKKIKDLYYGEPESSVVNQIEEYLASDGLEAKDRCIVGHNIINFDKKFIHAMFDRQNKKFSADLWVDTLQMMRAYYKKQNHKTKLTKLASCCEYFGIKKSAGLHNAIDDTRSNYYLWLKLLESGFDYVSYIKRFPHGVEESLNSEEEDELLAESLS